MAKGSGSFVCTIALHDDSVSKTHVLCSSALLPHGAVAYLSAPGATRLCFTAKDAARSADQVSVHASIAQQFGFRNTMRASIEVVQDIEAATATHIEVFFRDQHLSRADMWRLEALIDGSVLYQGQRLSYLGSSVATVDSVYISGQRVDSAYILHPNTRLIFRSGSARYLLLIQISQEMLEDWNNGDLMSERLIDGFLSDLFRRWDAHKAHHQVTIVLFGRRLPEHVQQGQDSSTDVRHEDFYQVIATDVPSSSGKRLLQQIKRIFNDVKLPRDVTLAARGNMVEAINIAASEFVQDNVDPRLATTGSAIIPITAGTGLFDADHELLRRTTRLLMGNSVGVDIVSLAPKPLHPVPLFRYKLAGNTEYALPHWADISYWCAAGDTGSSYWLPPSCNNEVLDISLPCLDLDQPISQEQFDHYDQQVFCKPGSSKPFEPPAILATDARSSTATSKATAEVADSSISTFAPRRDVSRPSSSSGLRQTKPAASPHPLMQIGRKISVGPKGLALSSGVASTTVSTEYAQHGRETSSAISVSTNEGPSNLAKQIRASLRKKPSQASFAASEMFDPPVPSNPIPVRTSEEQQTGSQPDPASLIEQAVMKHSRSSGFDDSLSGTPRPDGVLQEEELLQHHHAVLSPWLTLLNPCNPRKENTRVASEYRQWQNVFPTAVTPDSVRWESMVSPAILPLLRESRVSSAELEQRFEKQVRRLVISAGSVQVALRRMIALRLSAGFQVVPTRKVKDTQMPSQTIERILLSVGDYYHELRCFSDMEIQVSEFFHDHPATYARDETSYQASIQSFRGRRAGTASLQLQDSHQNTDWPLLDDECVNPDVEAGRSGHSRMRLVLVPVDFPPQAEGRLSSRELSDEERRIDGIQRLTQLWNRHVSDEQQRHHASINKAGTSSLVDRDPDPLAIEYQTRDPSAVVSGHGIQSNEPFGGNANVSLFPKSDQYHSSNFDLVKLSRHLQEPPPHGVEMKDRRWLTRFHLKCFRGDEMTNWLLLVFKDLGTREDAVWLGNELMAKGIFTHVRGKHEFRDGNYFYQVKSAYRTTVYPDTAGLFAKGVGRTAPTTPISDWKQSPKMRPVQGDSDSSSRGSSTPILGPAVSTAKEAILLSQKMEYNADNGKKSNQSELLDLHYDRIHNPDNCYHIQLEWSTTTPKLIREAVSRWASLVEGNGLKLVQVPIKEASKLHTNRPLDQPMFVRLAQLPILKGSITPHLEPHISSPRPGEDRDQYHKAILRKMGFVLDLESASSFPQALDISYSWGRPSYKFTQFLHKSGVLLAQITNDDNSDFLLVRNRLANQWTTNSSRRTELDSADGVVGEFVRFCRDKAALKAFYEDYQRPRVSPMSPLNGVTSPTDADVPPMELPPHLIHRPQR